MPAASPGISPHAVWYHTMEFPPPASDASQEKPANFATSFKPVRRVGHNNGFEIS